MHNEMSLTKTVIMVGKNICGLTLVAANGILRKHYVKIVCLTAFAGYLYLIS
jgi:hypothetical protein